jgi:hypothetical protein
VKICAVIGDLVAKIASLKKNTFTIVAREKKKFLGIVQSQRERKIIKIFFNMFSQLVYVGWQSRG